jgi:hypothetical protein
MAQQLSNNLNYKFFLKEESYIIGGLNEISRFIANLYNCFKVDLIHQQFLKTDTIVLDNINDFHVHSLDNILKHIGYSVTEEFEHNAIDKQLNGFFPYFDNNTVEEACEIFVKKSKLDEYTKESIIDSLRNFKIEIEISSEIHLLYDDLSNLNYFIPFIQDISLEKEIRLTKLRIYYTKLIEAIDKNKEIISSNKSKVNHKVCANIINNKLEDFKYNIETNLIEYLNDLNSKESSPSNFELFDSPNKDIFIKLNTYESFLHYIENFIVEPYADISYLFQRLKHKKLIYNIKHLEFNNYLKKQGLISLKVYEDIDGKGAFRSLTKSTSNARENNFNKTFRI